jgi:hypothetical protein
MGGMGWCVSVEVELDGLGLCVVATVRCSSGECWGNVVEERERERRGEKESYGRGDGAAAVRWRAGWLHTSCHGTHRRFLRVALADNGIWLCMCMNICINICMRRDGDGDGDGDGQA